MEQLELIRCAFWQAQKEGRASSTDQSATESTTVRLVRNYLGDFKLSDHIDLTPPRYH